MNPDAERLVVEALLEVRLAMKPLVNERPEPEIAVDEQVEISLPYSGEKFAVPQNLYIIGTMITSVNLS